MSLHLMLQDRIEEGLARFARIEPGELRARMAYDYLRAVVLFHQGEPGIQPNGTLEVALDVERDFTRVPLPEAFRKGSVLVDAEGGGVSRLQVLDSRSMETFRDPVGRTVQVFERATRMPLPRCYAKVFVEGMDGTVRFHKDGYTDLRGMFDYGSHTGSEGGEFRKVSIFMSHPEHGARIEVDNR